MMVEEEAAGPVQQQHVADTGQQDGGRMSHRSAVAAGRRRAALLARAVEREVIPRLLEAHPRPEADVPRVTPAHVAALVGLTLARDQERSVGQVLALHASGIPAEALYLELLTPAARRLGQMWENDDCDFTDVTVGLFHLQAAQRQLSPAFVGQIAPEADAPRVFLAPLPGEQHTLGLSIVDDFFRRAGWHTWSGSVTSAVELGAMLRQEWFDVVGLSFTCDEQLESGRRLIAMVRGVSRNPAVAVMAGGPGFSVNPALVRAVGADGTAADGRGSVMEATLLLTRAAARPGV